MIRSDADRGGFVRALEATREQLVLRANRAQDTRQGFDGLDEGDLQNVARRFEGLFMSMLVKEMRQTLPEGLFGSGPGTETFEGWFDEHIGDLLATTGPLELIGLLKAGQAAPGTLKDPDGNRTTAHEEDSRS